MKLLFLTPHLPYPTLQGTAIRNYNLIHRLARHHAIDLLTFTASDEVLAPDNPLFDDCERILAIPQPVRSSSVRVRDTFLRAAPDMALRLDSPHMHAAVSRWLADGAYDAVQSEGIEMGRYGMQAAMYAGVPHVFDDHNCEYLLQKRNAFTDLGIPNRWPAAGYSLIQWQKLSRFERDVMRSAQWTVAVSAADADALRAIEPSARIIVAPNGVALDDYAPRPPDADPCASSSAENPARLVFTGKMDYRPNIDAALWFAQEVLPRIADVRPDVRFQIVGRNPHARLDVLRSNPRIEITGAVSDIRPWIYGAAVCVIPLRVGGGTRFKALEAMACAVPIVSTQLGVEGIGVEHLREMLLADAPDSFADAVLTVIEPGNGNLRTHLAQEARRFVEAHYAWAPIVDRLESVYDQLHAGAARNAAPHAGQGLAQTQPS